MTPIDPALLEPALAAEFRARPMGRHSDALQRLLNRMRIDPRTAPYLLVATVAGQRWTIGRRGGRRGDPIRRADRRDFARFDAAEWAVFALRWEILAGAPPPGAEPARPDPVGEPLESEPLHVLGYLDRLTVRPGETVTVMASCETGAEAFEAELLRLRCADDTAEGPGWKAEPVAAAGAGRHPGRRQPVDAGSCAVVEGLPAAAGFGIGLLVWPTLPGDGEQTIASRWSEGSGWALTLDATGGATLRIGDGCGTIRTLAVGRPMLARRWYRVAAGLDPASGRATVEQRPLAPLPHDASGGAVSADVGASGRSPSVPRPLILAGQYAGGRGGRPVVEGHFEGKLEAPVLADRPLTAAEAAAIGDPAAVLAFGPGLRAAWDFGLPDMAGDRIPDLTGHGHDAVLVNRPTRAVTGHRWAGEVFDWRHDPGQYAAIHFHSDDLDDAHWEPGCAITVPTEARSGVYAVRLACPGRDGSGAEVLLPLFVSPPLGTAAAPLALLIPTATYSAYADSHHAWDDPLAELCYGGVLSLGPAEMLLNQRRDLGLSTYDVHRDGSGVVHASRRRPLVNLRAKGAVWNFVADTHLADWLEAVGQPYDLVTDDDLHRDGIARLAPYRCVMTGTHPEYFSRTMLDAVEAYGQGGGRLVYPGGNGFYWRIAVHPERADVIEVRRAEGGSRCHIAPAGEYHMAATGELGGLWRHCGRPPQRLVGVGYASAGFDVSSHYRRLPDSRDPRAAWIFDGVEGETFGDFGSCGGGAAGWELDLADPALGTPPHALRLAVSEGHSNVYVLTPEEMVSAHPGMDGIDSPRVRSDIVFFETPGGGAVFSVGSIAWAGALAWNGYDNPVARIMRNVVRRFLDPRPFD